MTVTRLVTRQVQFPEMAKSGLWSVEVMEKAKAYIKSSLGGKASPARETDAATDGEPRVCFVCGGAGLGDCYAVRVKPDPQSSEPYFPFLGAHPPPAGYQLENYSKQVSHSSEPYFPFLGAHPPPAGYQAEGEEEGTVRCCCVCYTFLRQQWEQYDRENKPHSQRFYWMKRLDGKPFIEPPTALFAAQIARLIGADMSFQGEYAAQVLGLGAETGANREESGNPATPGATAAPRAAEPPPPTTVPTPTPTTTPRPKDVDTNHNAKFNNSSVQQRYPSGGNGGAGATEEEGVLDLRARDPSVISVGSQHSGASESAGYLDAVRSTVSVYSGNSNSSSDRDILDLSMPDKNSMTEVCYVCGDEYKRGTLCNLNTKEPKDKMNKQPYFPIFGEQHPRPPRSRPKDAQGTVRACAACHHHLLQQWNTYQTRGVSAHERVYTLRTRPPSLLPPSPLSLASSGDKSLAAAARSPSLERPPSQATASFVCYVCGVPAPSSQLRLVYCCPNPEREPYYPFITGLKPHPDASPISPQAYGENGEPNAAHNNTHANNIRFKPYDMKSSSSSQSNKRPSNALSSSPQSQIVSGENGMGLYRRQQQQHLLHELASLSEIPRPQRRHASSGSNFKYSLMSVVLET
ncbi:hypothetical protein RR48_03645 [Papilio machaon]|uniref:Uncharacterized protein n=1 Tax=Papilio machaon TaxID=76193 RepID=A0A0N1IFV4_PAPMA|nr:hypothetical protein RR48_03645 [Papilio machaon]